jgi:hypothetical protein
VGESGPRGALAADELEDDEELRNRVDDDATEDDKREIDETDDGGEASVMVGLATCRIGLLVFVAVLGVMGRALAAKSMRRCESSAAFSCRARMLERRLRSSDSA